MLRNGARKSRRVGRVHHRRDVLVGFRRLLRDAAHRRALHDDAARGELVHHRAAFPGLQRLVPAHRAPGAVAGRAEGERLGFLRSGEHVGAGTHRAADQHRLARRAQRPRHVGMTRAEGARRAFPVHVELALAPVGAVLFHLAGVVRHVVEERQPRLRQHAAEDLPHQVGEDLAVGERAVDPCAHRAEIVLADLGINRRAGELAIGKTDAVLRGGDRHPLQEIGADLVPEASRAAVDHHHDVAERKAVRPRDRLVVHAGHFLHFEIVVAAAERTHLVALALFRLRRDATGLGVLHLPVLLDSLEILGHAPAALHRPRGSAREHRVHLRVAEADLAGAADARGDGTGELVRERLLHRHHVRARQSGVQAAHAAGNVEAHSARRHYPALVRVECSHAADRKSVAPVRVRHGVGRLHDAGQRGDVHRLLVHLAVHVAHQRLAREDHRRHAHRALLRDLPLVFRAPLEEIQVHVTRLPRSAPPSRRCRARREASCRWRPSLPPPDGAARRPPARPRPRRRACRPGCAP